MKGCLRALGWALIGFALGVVFHRAVVTGVWVYDEVGLFALVAGAGGGFLLNNAFLQAKAAVILSVFLFISTTTAYATPRVRGGGSSQAVIVEFAIGEGTDPVDSIVIPVVAEGGNFRAFWDGVIGESKCFTRIEVRGTLSRVASGAAVRLVVKASSILGYSSVGESAIMHEQSVSGPVVFFEDPDKRVWIGDLFFPLLDKDGSVIPSWLMITVGVPSLPAARESQMQERGRQEHRGSVNQIQNAVPNGRQQRIQGNEGERDTPPSRGREMCDVPSLCLSRWRAAEAG